MKNGQLTDALIYESVKSGTALNEAIEDTLKGKEMKMPNGLSFKDKDGAKRTDIRIKWWEDPSQTTYKNISVEAIADLPEEPIDITTLKNKDFYGLDSKMVFFGHYWLKGQPSIYRDNICCLDYSIAKGGHLVAYRLDDESQLDNSKLIYV